MQNGQVKVNQTRADLGVSMDNIYSSCGSNGSPTVAQHPTYPMRAATGTDFENHLYGRDSFLPEVQVDND